MKSTSNAALATLMATLSFPLLSEAFYTHTNQVTRTQSQPLQMVQLSRDQDTGIRTFHELSPWSNMWNMMETVNDLSTMMGFPAETSSDVATAGRQKLTFPIDVSESKGQLIVKADLPGLKKDDITIDINKNVLSIRAERKYEHEEGDEKKLFYRSERSYGSVMRSIPLPMDVDTTGDVKALYKDGVLNIMFKKLEKGKGEQRKIQIMEG